MKRITQDMVINEVIRKYPDTLRVFSRFEIDSCCGGSHTLEEAAKAKGISLEVLIRELGSISPDSQKVG